jgi:hypothetical protein
VRFRRALLIGAACAVVGVFLVLVGKWEEHRAAQHEMREMRIVLNAIGDLTRRRPTGYRTGPPVCFAYATPGNLFGLQVCFDQSGRVVETVDRRPIQPRYASLVYDPGLSTLRVSPKLVQALMTLKRIPE